MLHDLTLEALLLSPQAHVSDCVQVQVYCTCSDDVIAVISALLPPACTQYCNTFKHENVQAIFSGHQLVRRKCRKVKRELFGLSARKRGKFQGSSTGQISYNNNITYWSRCVAVTHACCRLVFLGFTL